MNHRDVWFVGLLALAYLYVDASAPPTRRDAPARQRPLPPEAENPVEEPRAWPAVESCPRDLSHVISLRGDGAKWCLACDEAFYPAPL